MAPGSKVGDNQTQRRHLLTNMNEVYELFKTKGLISSYGGTNLLHFDLTT